MTTKSALLGLAMILLTGCAVEDGAAESSEVGELASVTGGGGVHTARQAKQIVIDLWNTLGTGDLDGYIAGLSDDVRWNVNARFLPWGGEREGAEAVRAFFIQVLGIVAVTSFATIPDETIAERVGHCRFLVDLKTEERVVSLRDPTRSVDVTFRYVTTVGCDGKVSAVDIFDDSGAVEHMLRDAGDIP
jgi:hypothetical protein